MADSTREAVLTRCPPGSRERIKAAADQAGVSANAWQWRAFVAALEGGDRVSPEQEKGASLAPAPPRARTSSAAKAGVRPQPKQGKR